MVKGRVNVRNNPAEYRPNEIEQVKPSATVHQFNGAVLLVDMRQKWERIVTIIRGLGGVLKRKSDNDTIIVTNIVMNQLWAIKEDKPKGTRASSRGKSIFDVT